MDAAYRLGTSIVVAVVIASAGLSALLGLKPADRPAAQDLGAGAFPLGSFRLTERSGRTITESDLAGTPWVAAFIFTRCPSSCPRISATMKGLQETFAGTGVKLVSISVDPEHDTPEVLAKYAAGFGADPARWLFLTGPKDEVYDLILGRFKLGVRGSSEADQKEGAEAVSHSNRLSLVGRDNAVVGSFVSDDAEAVANLIKKAKSLDGDLPWVRSLPALNAGLNGTCAVLLVLGWTLIRSGRWRAHAAAMIAAVTVSAVFLACYLFYHYHVGSVPFRGVGLVRPTYFTILISHTILATFGVVPLVSATLYQAARRRFADHARVARVTFPIWLYVSVTGVVIYLMLYQMPVSASPG